MMRLISYIKKKISKRKEHKRRKLLLRTYYQAKITGPVQDIAIGTYYGTLREYDIDVMSLNLSVGFYDLRCRLIYIERMDQYESNNVGFEVIGSVGEKDIFQCENFDEFVELYGEIILFLLESYDEILDNNIRVYRYTPE